MEKIYQILTNLRPESDFQNAKDFIDDGLLDSFDIVSLISELEEEFQILIDPLDIVPENFGTVKQITEIVKKNGGQL